MSRWTGDEVIIECPFCKKIVVKDYEDMFELEDGDEVPDGYMVSDDELFGDVVLCEHVALYCCWGYDYPEIRGQYLEPILRVYNAISEGSKKRG
mgnify:CR=1 FL=1